MWLILTSYRSQTGDTARHDTDSFYLPPLSEAAGPAAGERAPTFQPVLEAVLQHHEELLQGREVGVQGPAQAQGRLDQDFDTELHHVHEVGALLHGVVPRTWAGGHGRGKKSCF